MWVLRRSLIVPNLLLDLAPPFCLPWRLKFSRCPLIYYIARLLKTTHLSRQTLTQMKGTMSFHSNLPSLCSGSSDVSLSWSELFKHSQWRKISPVQYAGVLLTSLTLPLRTHSPYILKTCFMRCVVLLNFLLSLPHTTTTRNTSQWIPGNSGEPITAPPCHTSCAHRESLRLLDFNSWPKPSAVLHRCGCSGLPCPFWTFPLDL